MRAGRRVLTALLAAAALGVVAPGVAQADEECHVIDGRGAGYETGPGTTVATIRGAGLLTGTTAGEFTAVPNEDGSFRLTGTVDFTVNRAALAVDVAGTLTLTSPEGDIRFDVESTGFTGTGKLAGVSAGTSDLRLAGVGVLGGAFTETVTGTICVDLAP